MEQFKLMIAQSNDEILTCLIELHSDLMGWNINEGTVEDANAYQEKLLALEDEQDRRKAERAL